MSLADSDTSKENGTNHRHRVKNAITCWEGIPSFYWLDKKKLHDLTHPNQSNKTKSHSFDFQSLDSYVGSLC